MRVFTLAATVAAITASAAHAKTVTLRNLCEGPVAAAIASVATDDTDPSDYAAGDHWLVDGVAAIEANGGEVTFSIAPNVETAYLHAANGAAPLTVRQFTLCATDLRAPNLQNFVLRQELAVDTAGANKVHLFRAFQDQDGQIESKDAVGTALNGRCVGEGITAVDSFQALTLFDGAASETFYEFCGGL